MILRKLLLLVFTVSTLSACLGSSSNQADAIATVTSNTLDNGLFYSIHAKQENSDKIQLRLMVNSGSFSETDAQSGYAHLLEHMAFNGTKHFPKHKIIELFEKSGLTFGYDINAYTTFNATVYTLSVPKSDAKLLADALLYLRDVLSAIEFDQAELDKEKGVVENEYQLRMPKEKSYYDLLFTDYIEGSEYAERLPIGTLEVINNSTVASVKDFYKTWYRPDNAKLLITGDVDSKKTALLVMEIFSSLEKSKNRNKQITPAAPRLKTESQAYSSKVINFAQTDLFFEIPALSIRSGDDLSHAFKLDILDNLFNYRLNAANNLQVQPFSEVGFTYYQLLDNKALKNIYIDHLQGQSQQAIYFIAQELARINQYGFSQEEYKQQIEQFKSSQADLTNHYINKNSAQLADDAINAWSNGNIEYTLAIEQQAYQTVLTTISLQEINQLANKLLSTPSKLAFSTPYQSSKPDLLMLNKIFADTIKKPVNNRSIKIKKLTLPIVKKSVSGSKIESEKFYPEQQITQWHLSNGVDVVLQPDHSVKNSISMSFTAPGGENSLTEKQLSANHLLINSYTNSGLAGLSSQALQQKFIKAKVDFIALIAENHHGFTMHSVNEPKSLELLFSMLYSAFTDARIKENIFALEKKSSIEDLKSRLKAPTATISKKLLNKLFPDNNRQKEFSVEQLQAVQKNDVEALYQALFSSANNYKLTIVGDFETAQLKPVILQYIASLPTGKEHKFSRTPQSLIMQASELNETTNPQDNALVLFYAVTDTPNQSIKDVYQAVLMERIIDQALIKIVREQLSLTYSPYVMVTDQQPGLAFTVVVIKVITKVKDAKLTRQAVDKIVNNFLENGITQEQLSDHKKSLKLDMATELKASPDRQWLLHEDHLFGYELGSTENVSSILDSISIDDMNRFFQVYLAPQKTLRIINVPEKS